ncbi:MAG: SpoIIE family protein phosphatase [Ignavibacteria bacterium]|nr:SpoIIE family protein phosphatase [Ignavibacteria bacterium]MBT8382219.1 SpoIIE family protein phosphatase [Ignavibacteria bacterium]MBT8391454.1 SpoIIE family protein phosphatase [Ignavibacteria bacterium]NNJ54117.1 SpoIIE family protein phosphatase [Ignavibacteriaceae bacterium]NNL21384.1 SpoIIE family protein phosphatase [Ignavibacteriaceae bacterium]
MAEVKDYKIKRNLSALIDFSRVINSSIDLEFILNNVLLTCLGKFLATRGLIAVKEKGKLVLKVSKGLNAEDETAFPYLLATPECIEDPKLDSFMHVTNMKIVEKISSSQDCIGLVCLGEKLNKSGYTEDDQEFLRTILNISATAIQNSIIISELREVNRLLDTRVQRLDSLFELSKEFGMLAESSRFVKLLIFSVIGQFLVQKYAVVLFKDEPEILESKFSRSDLQKCLSEYELINTLESIRNEEISEQYKLLKEIGVHLVVPMQLQGNTRGLILLGNRAGDKEYLDSDVEFIYSVGNLAIISLENKRLFEEALEKQKLEEELLIARDIQQNLLPQNIPFHENFEIAALNVSSKQVGGDYYDVIPLDDDNFVVAIADVSGKGVPASLMMANIQAFLQVICKHDLKIDEATALINNLVTANTTEGRFITFFWGVVNTKQKTIKYVNAGHNPPLLLRNNAVNKLDKGGIILGVMETVNPYIFEEVDLYKDDVLILFTDGVSEAMNLSGEEFGEDKLEETANALKVNSAKEILDGIKHEVQRFAQGNIQSDDITMLVLKVS